MTSNDRSFRRFPRFLLASILVLLVSMPAVAEDEIEDHGEGLAYRDHSMRMARSVVDSACKLRQAKIVIPGGKQAVDFELDVLESGVNCHSSLAIPDRGWGVSTSTSKGGDVYRYFRAGRAGSEARSTMPLSNLKLKPGVYYLFVDGGKGANVVVGYRLVKYP